MVMFTTVWWDSTVVPLRFSWFNFLKSQGECDLSAFPLYHCILFLSQRWHQIFKRCTPAFSTHFRQALWCASFSFASYEHTHCDTPDCLPYTHMWTEDPTTCNSHPVLLLSGSCHHPFLGKMTCNFFSLHIEQTDDCLRCWRTILFCANISANKASFPHVCLVEQK